MPLARRLLVLQVALSLVLLVGAGLFVRSLRNLATADLGIARDNLYMVTVDPSPSKAVKNPEQFWRRMMARVAAVPGVRSVSVAGDWVFGNGGWNTGVWYRQADGAEHGQQLAFNLVSPGFFATVGIPLLAGREFGAQDQPHAQPVAVINQTFARTLFAGDNPIGQHFGDAGPGSSGRIEVVGVIADAKYGGVRDQPRPMFYMPLAQHFEPRAYEVHVRTAGKPVVEAVRREIQSMDPDISVYPAHSIPDVIQGLLQHDRMFAILAGAFGVLALLLTSVGIYGVVTYQVTRRTNEIGIRMTLGASRKDILWMVMRDTLLVLSIGGVMGLPAAAFAGRWIRSVLYALEPADATAIAYGLTVLTVAGVLAAFLPARRASKLDPMVALRYE